MSPFDSYIASARTMPGLWRMLIGILLIGCFWVLCMVLLLIAWLGGKVASGVGLDDALEQMGRLQTNPDPLLIAIMLLSFSGIWIGVLTALPWLHRQRFSSIFAPQHRTGQALVGFAKGACITLLAIPVFYLLSLAAGADPGPVQELMPFDQWILWIAPMILLVFIQATGEELIFRGYLLQQLAVRSKHWLIWAVLPSLLFGSLHYNGAETGLLYVTTTAITGLVFCVLVWRSGSLWPAIGYHVANNIYALTIISVDPETSSTQLFAYPDADMQELLLLDIVFSILLLATVISPLGRVFNRRNA